MDSTKQSKPLIELKSLSKQYRGTKTFSLKNVTLHVMPGEVYGFLGANGAGKSTAIRTLLNFIQPTNGSAQIMGYDIVRDSVKIKKHVGYLSGDVALYNKLTGRQFLDYMIDLQPLRNEAYMKHLVQKFEVDLKKPIGDLSKGNRQKIGILQAFGHEPDVLILDEPTSGIDPLMQEVFFEAVREAKERGACVFFSSHNLSEVQRICDRVGFIRDGKLIREQSISSLTLQASHTFDVYFTAEAPQVVLSKIRGAEVTVGADTKHATVVLPSASLTQFFGILAQYKIEQFHQREANLEEEFLNFYKEKGKTK